MELSYDNWLTEGCDRGFDHLEDTCTCGCFFEDHPPRPVYDEDGEQIDEVFPCWVCGPEKCPGFVEADNDNCPL